MTIPPIEFFDIVDTNDHPTGQVLSRNDAYAQKARFRIAHVYLFNADFTQVYLQQRSAAKSFAPLAWSASVVGHVSAGESWLQGATREMVEELNLKLPLHFLGASDWFDKAAQHYLMNGVFYAILPAAMRLELAENEVAEVKAVAVKDIAQWLDPQNLQHPAFASTWAFLEKHLPNLCPKAAS